MRVFMGCLGLVVIAVGLIALWFCWSVVREGISSPITVVFLCFLGLGGAGCLAAGSWMVRR